MVGPAHKLGQVDGLEQQASPEAVRAAQNVLKVVATMEQMEEKPLLTSQEVIDASLEHAKVQTDIDNLLETWVKETASVPNSGHAQELVGCKQESRDVAGGYKASRARAKLGSIEQDLAALEQAFMRLQREGTPEFPETKERYGDVYRSMAALENGFAVLLHDRIAHRIEAVRRAAGMTQVQIQPLLKKIVLGENGEIDMTAVRTAAERLMELETKLETHKKLTPDAIVRASRGIDPSSVQEEVHRRITEVEGTDA